MLVSTHALEYFLDTSSLDISQLGLDLSQVGLEVEKVERFNLPRKVIVAQVLSKSPHPNADKLSICQVDTGSETLQIVCGARNVEVGQFVALALQGAYLPACDLHIAKSTLRGVQSSGMLCSSAELGLPKVHEGILILDASLNHNHALTLGQELATLPFFRTAFLEIALTPNRGDCLSVLGIAREISALYAIPLGSLPSVPKGASLPICLHTQESTPYLVLGFALLESPPTELPLEITLTLACQENLSPHPLSNLLEYATYLSGVILHAYPDAPLDLREDAWGFVHASQLAEELNTLGVSVPALKSSMAYLLEASFLDPTYLSQKLHAHPQECSQALVYRTKRGSNPDVQMGLDVLFHLLQRFFPHASLRSATPTTPPLSAKTLSFNAQDVTNILGTETKEARIQEILESLGFILSLKRGVFKAQIPLYRHDISTIQDIAEEILRFDGLDKLPKAILYTSEESSANPHYLRYLFERQLATRALSLQFKEVVHYLFAKKENLIELGYSTLREELDLLNPINSDLNTLRTSLVPGLLQALARNKNLGFKSVALFELGSIYDANRQESNSLAFLASGLKSTPHYPHPKGMPWDFYSFANALSLILGKFELEPITEQQRRDRPYLQTTYHPYQSALIMQEGKEIGVLGAINPILVQKKELLEGFIAEIASASLHPKPYKAQEFSKLPTSFRDLTILINKDCIFALLKQSIQEASIPHLKEVFALDIYPEGQEKIALSLRLKIQAQEPLNDAQLQEVIDRVLQVLEVHFNAKLKL